MKSYGACFVLHAERMCGLNVFRMVLLALLFRSCFSCFLDFCLVFPMQVQLLQLLTATAAEPEKQHMLYLPNFHSEQNMSLPSIGAASPYMFHERHYGSFVLRHIEIVIERDPPILGICWQVLDTGKCAGLIFQTKFHSRPKLTLCSTTYSALLVVVRKGNLRNRIACRMKHFSPLHGLLSTLLITTRHCCALCDSKVCHNFHNHQIPVRH